VAYLARDIFVRSEFLGMVENRRRIHTDPGFLGGRGDGGGKKGGREWFWALVFVIDAGAKVHIQNQVFHSQSKHNYLETVDGERGNCCHVMTFSTNIGD
jgi:hypothetical protein